MARKRVENGIKTWQEVDEALLVIGQLDRQIEQKEADLQEYIEELKGQTVADVKPLMEQKHALELQLQAFCEAHRDDLGQKKSRQLNFGTVSFRRSTKIVIRGVRTCVELLKGLGLLDCLKVKETPDKERLRELDDTVLVKVGAKRVEEEAFGYEVDRERVKEAA